MIGKLSGHVTVVTGAGAGIGEAIAKRFAAESAAVAVADVNFDAALRVRDDIRANGGQAIALEMDVTDRVQVRTGMSRAHAEFGRLDVAVCNAGISFSKELLDTTEDDWMRCQLVNGMGMMITMQEAAKLMIADNTAGKIINLTSISGRRNNSDWVAYAASKAVTSSLIQSGARELAPYGITVTGIAPGIVETPLWSGIYDNENELAAHMSQYAQEIPLGYVSKAEDLTGTAVFLASAESNYVTGEIITIDGGITA